MLPAPRQVPQAKCAERNGYLLRHHFPRALRLCPPNLAGEPPFAVPRGRSLDIPYYGAKPTPCQVGTEQARINLDALLKFMGGTRTHGELIEGALPCQSLSPILEGTPG